MQPEMVFTNYELEDMNGIELIKKSKEELNTKMPIFNFVADNLSKEQVNQIIESSGIKINALIPEQDKEERIKEILNNYKEFTD